MSNNTQTNLVRVRFPNESYYDILDNFKWEDFRAEKFYYDCVFGWYQDVYVCVNKEDYEESKNNR
jgi:hypothetical protein